jgi:serine/threonine protein kinase
LSGDEACKDEFKNLKELRECLSDHKRIMVNLVTMVEKTSQNNIYHIVYELAAYDLNVFLTHMPQRLRYERHVTPSRERTDSANMWPGDLISESVNLADALDYLHNRLYTKSHTSLKSHVSLSHNDIKPENILVVYPETTNKHDRFPVGQWKFADFGLSVVKVNRSSGIHGKHLSADNAAALNPSQPLQRTHRTERPSSVSQAMPARPPGQYTAPEMDQPTPQLADCRRADVWSFGCVLSEIVTYAVKLDCQLVEEFRNSLGKSEGPSQRSLPDPHFYDHETKDVKPQFLNHLDKLPSKAHGDKRIPEDTHWISSCVDLIKGIVRKEPKERLEANKIRAKLSKIDLSMRPEKREWLSHDLTLDLANVDTDPAISGQASAVSQSPTEYDDSDYARDEALNRVPSICFHPAEHSMPEITRPRHNGEDERRRATAPR